MASEDFVEASKTIKKALRLKQYKRIPHKNIELYTTSLRNETGEFPISKDSQYSLFGEILFVLKRIKVEEKEDEEIKECILNEGKTLQSLSHPNILQIFHAHTSFKEDIQKHLLLICMPYLKGGDLFPFTQEYEGFSLFNLMTSQIMDIALRLCEAIDYLHNEALFVHRDIKPENILLENPFDFNTLKLCDFGFAAKVCQDKDSFQTISLSENGNPGTFSFAAPELFGMYQTKTPKASDCWAFGVTLFCLMEKRMPFTGTTVGKLEHAIKTKNIDYFSFFRLRNPFLSKLISQLLIKDPHKRMTASSALFELRKEFSFLSMK